MEGVAEYSGEVLREPREGIARARRKAESPHTQDKGG